MSRVIGPSQRQLLALCICSWHVLQGPSALYVRSPSVGLAEQLEMNSVDVRGFQTMIGLMGPHPLYPGSPQQ